jgi:hypothetical protein
VKKFSDSNLERDKGPIIQPFQTRSDLPTLRFRCTRDVLLRLNISAICAIFEALESESGEATITSGSGGTTSDSFKLWSSELSEDDPDCDECSVVSCAFMGNSTSVLGPLNTALSTARMRARAGPTFGCGVVSGTTGGRALVDVGAVGEEISCMRHICRGITELIASSGDVM